MTMMTIVMAIVTIPMLMQPIDYQHIVSGTVADFSFVSSRSRGDRVPRNRNRRSHFWPHPHPHPGSRRCEVAISIMMTTTMIFTSFLFLGWPPLLWDGPCSVIPIVVPIVVPVVPIVVPFVPTVPFVPAVPFVPVGSGVLVLELIAADMLDLVICAFTNTTRVHTEF